MTIGGTDIVFRCPGCPAAMDACVQVILAYWPKATFEDALTGEKWARYQDIPFGKVTDLFIYGEHLIYLIRRTADITLVLLEPMPEMMESVRLALKHLPWRAA